MRIWGARRRSRVLEAHFAWRRSWAGVLFRGSGRSIVAACLAAPQSAGGPRLKKVPVPNLRGQFEGSRRLVRHRLRVMVPCKG